MNDKPVTATPYDDIPNPDIVPIDGNNRNNVMVPDEGGHTASGHLELDRHSPRKVIQYQRFNSNPRKRTAGYQNSPC